MVLLSLSLAECIQLISVIIAFATCSFLGIQIWQKVRMSHAEQVAKMIDKIQYDPKLQNLFYDIEYNRFQYSSDFHGSDLEKTVDELLHHYEYVLYLQERGLLKKQEFLFFEYDIQRIVENKNMQDYLFNLYHFVDWGSLSFKYQRLLSYGRNEGCISAEFDNPKSSYYKHVLRNACNTI